jgi:phosphoglycolate phosphatase
MARIVFDLDGTLVHSTPTLCASGNALLGELGRGAVDDETYAGFVGHGIPHQVKSLLEHTGGIPGGDLAPHLARYREIYDANASDGTVLYGAVLEVLQKLRRYGHVLGVCTQKPEAPTLAILADLGLAPLITGVTTGDSLDVLKPDPLMLAHTAGQMGAGMLIYVGDSETDALTAANAGVLFLLYAYGYRRTRLRDIANDGIFTDFQDLPAMIERLQRG